MSFLASAGIPDTIKRDASRILDSGFRQSDETIFAMLLD
jgi:hypothetical protein